MIIDGGLDQGAGGQEVCSLGQPDQGEPLRAEHDPLDPRGLHQLLPAYHLSCLQRVDDLFVQLLKMIL